MIYFGEIEIIGFDDFLQPLENMLRLFINGLYTGRLGGGEYFAYEYLVPAEPIFFFILETVRDENFAEIADGNFNGEFDRNSLRHDYQIVHRLDIPRRSAYKHLIVHNA